MTAHNETSSEQELCDEPIYTVSELNAQTRHTLETRFNSIWLIGEISNLARPASGHLYLTLKDQHAQVRSALFRQSARKLNFTPKNGQQVLVRAAVSLYEARGDFQLIIASMEPAGEGALQLAFEKLKRKLAALGLFDPEHKKPLPPYIKTVGVITSSSGAAIRDILKVLRRRCQSLSVIIYPTLVQGENAKTQIVDAIETANRRGECDVILLTRGGGSLEDLWAFNEVCVAEAIFNSKLPIVTGIGHEIDFTIADLCADHRAATPSAAAELISPDINHWIAQLKQLGVRLQQIQKNQLQYAKQTLESLTKRLRHPEMQLEEVEKKLLHQYQQLNLMIKNQFHQKYHLLQNTVTKLLQTNPQHQLKHIRSQHKTLCQRLITASEHVLTQKQNQLEALTQQIDTVSPLKTLNRGYAIVTRADNKQLIRSSKEIKINDIVDVRLNQGGFSAKVEQKLSD